MPVPSDWEDYKAAQDESNGEGKEEARRQLEREKIDWTHPWPGD